jgi:hypothetical protein
MAKYYVSSGNMNLIVEADHPRAAALWTVHRCLSPVAPFVSDEDELEPGANDRLSYESPESYRKLGETVAVSERGFGSDDSQILATLPLVAEWSRLLVAIDRLHQDLGQTKR